MEKKTAVEWLVEQICGDHTNEWQKQIDQAKEMEKKQIKDAYRFGIEDEYVIGSQKYYNETFNK